jgi:hypothetical protein
MVGLLRYQPAPCHSSPPPIWSGQLRPKDVPCVLAEQLERGHKVTLTNLS